MRGHGALLVLYLTGRFTMSALAQEAGLTPAEATRAIRRAGGRSEHRRRAGVGMARALLPQGVNLKDIAAHLNIAAETLSKWSRAHGLDPLAMYKERRSAFGSDGTKQCTGCGEVLKIDRFPLKLDSRSGAAFPIARCQDCEAARSREKQRLARASASCVASGYNRVHASYEVKRVRRGPKEARRRQWESHLKRVERALRASPEIQERIVRRCRKVGRRHWRQWFLAKHPLAVAASGYRLRMLRFDQAAQDRIRSKLRYWTNLPKERRRVKAYKNANPAMVAKWGQKRYSLAAAQSDGSLTRDVVLALYAKATECPYCGTGLVDDTRTLDHITPLSRGGAHSIRNVLVCCSSCNSRKKAKPVGRWLRGLSDADRVRATRAIREARARDAGQGELGLGWAS